MSTALSHSLSICLFHWLTVLLNPNLFCSHIFHSPFFSLVAQHYVKSILIMFSCLLVNKYTFFCHYTLLLILTQQSSGCLVHTFDTFSYLSHQTFRQRNHCYFDRVILQQGLCTYIHKGSVDVVAALAVDSDKEGQAAVRRQHVHAPVLLMVPWQQSDAAVFHTQRRRDHVQSLSKNTTQHSHITSVPLKCDLSCVHNHWC